MATTLKRKQKQTISLKGSTKIVTEFFEYSINSILYQRAIYPPDDFKMVKKYGLTLMTTCNEELEVYIRKVMGQVNEWILAGNVSRIVMAVVSKDTNHTLERWQFDVEIEKETTPTSQKPQKDKTLEQIQKEIQDIIRQITSSVTFLPSLEEKCTFNILVYTDKDIAVPEEWVDSDPHLIQGNVEKVKFRSFSTNIHKVDSVVAYRLSDDAI